MKGFAWDCAFCLQTNQLRAQPPNLPFLELLDAQPLSPCPSHPGPGIRQLAPSGQNPPKLFKVANPKPTCPSTPGCHARIPPPSASPPTLVSPSWPCWCGLPPPLGAVRRKPSCQGQGLLTCWPRHP